MIFTLSIMFIPDEDTLRSDLAQIMCTMSTQARDFHVISPSLEDTYYDIYNQLIALDPDAYAID